MKFIKNLFKSSAEIAKEKEERERKMSEFLKAVIPLLNKIYAKHYGQSYSREEHIFDHLSRHHDFSRNTWRYCFTLYRLRNSEKYPKDAPAPIDVALLAGFAKDRFHETAPKNAYGKNPLRISALQFKKELKAILSSDARERGQQCFIYRGKTEHGKVYIGQTTNVPEARYIQHRKLNTGPFKDGEVRVHWEVLMDCELSEADYWESYYIGIYKSHLSGYNDNRGNSPRGFADGNRESVSFV